MSNVFQNVKTKRVKRTAFDLTHEKKMSFNMAKLQPLIVQEVIPGDTFKVNAEIMVRFAPLIAPIMHRVNVYTHFFFVPNRLVWDGWQDFITGNVESLIPSFKTTDNAQFFAKGDLPEAFGLPNITNATLAPELEVSKLPFRAYNLIFNEYYRDQNLQTEVSLDNLKVLTRAWEKDYFTSALPFAQKGGEATIPIDSEINYLMPARARTVSSAPDGRVITDPQPVGPASDLKDEATGNGLRIENIDSIDSTITINNLRLHEPRLRQEFETMKE